MKTLVKKQIVLLIIIKLVLIGQVVFACSTFKLQKGDQLIYGHNLNQGDMGVPGMIFINKRGIFKIGRTWFELATKDRMNPSNFHWISRYGSVTFNTFSKDLPDGGINEAGLFIWEMNADFKDYPKNDKLPELDQMNWMQFVLDNYSSIEEVVESLNQIELSGWGWHFFVGDADGNTAAIDFTNDSIIIHKNGNMPVPALFNTTYEREMEILKFYKGYGGHYDIDLDDPEVPRFIKTSLLIDEYDVKESIVDYGLKMLETIQVYDYPEWSVLCDVMNGKIYFRTRVNKQIKSISLNNIDFSNKYSAMVQNIEIEDAGDVTNSFVPYTEELFSQYIKDELFSVLPEPYFTRGGLTLNEFSERFSSHSKDAAKKENQYFIGIWNSDKQDEKTAIKLTIATRADAVSGEISIAKKGKDFGDSYDLDHINLIGQNLCFTFKNKSEQFYEVKALLNENEMTLELLDKRYNHGKYLLTKE